MSSIESFAAALVAKFGAAKLLAGAATLIGALIMIVVEPPENRKDLFGRLVAAFAASWMFGHIACKITLSWISTVASGIDYTDVVVPVYGTIGGLGWSIFAVLNYWRKKLITAPKEAIQDAKDVVS